jgi:hypothetical protein
VFKDVEAEQPAQDIFRLSFGHGSDCVMMHC